MSQTIRHVVAASGVAIFVLCAAALPTAVTGPAFAQGGAPRKPAPIELTQKQIDGWIAAQPSIRSLESSGSSDPKLHAKMESIVKANGFASLDEYEAVSENVAVVIVGIEPGKGTYVGAGPTVKNQIAAIEADKTMKPAEKAAAIEEAKAALAAAEGSPPSPGNIAVVTKNYAKLLQVISGD